MRTTASNSMSPAVTLTVVGTPPSLRAVTPVMEKVSSPVRPRLSAVAPSGHWREIGRAHVCPTRRASGVGSQDVLQDPAVAVVVGFAGGVDADDGVELDVAGGDLDGGGDAAVVEGGDAGDGEGLLTGEAEAVGGGALGELEGDRKSTRLPYTARFRCGIAGRTAGSRRGGSSRLRRGCRCGRRRRTRCRRR